MDEYLYHTVDAGHIRNIGEQSVSNKIQAILELVKNAYDADSPDCTVSFHGTKDGGQTKIHTIMIEDHGIGMTKNDLRDKFMKVGTGTKVETSFSPKLKRRVSGEKGMGHYSAQRLGDKIVITTTPDLFKGRQVCKEDDTTYVLELDWSKYVPGEDFGRIPNRIHTIARRTPGTLIEISKLRDVWTTQGKSNDLESLTKNLGNVMLPKMMRSSAKDEFDARIKMIGFETDLPELQGTLLDYALYKIHASLHENNIRFKLFRRKKGSASMQPVKEDEIPADEATCGDARVTIYWFPGAVRDWASGAMAPRNLKDQLEDNCGIKIYNDKIRVMPYGEYGNDWLGLGTRKSGPATGGKVRNVHLVGFLRLSRANNPDIMETTTRQALRENDAFESLKEDFMMPVITEMENRVRKIVEAEAELAKKVYHYNVAQSELAKIKEITQHSSTDTRIKDNVTTRLSKVSRQIMLRENEYDKREEHLSASLEMYRNLSTIGIQTIAFNHEIINPLNFVNLTLTNLINKYEEVEPAKRVQYLEKCLGKVVSSLNWASHIKEFSSLLAGAGASRRQRSVIKIDDSLREIRNDMSPILDALHITMFDPIIMDTIPNIVMNRASFESIFINLISNSVRSLKRINRNRIIQVRVSKDDASVRIEFEDNGYGIDDGIKDKIFRLFFTTYRNPSDMGTGMGLAIVREIVEDDYHGSVMLAEAISEKTCPGRGMARFLVRLPLG